MVQVFPLEGIRHHGLVLYARDVRVSELLERSDGSFHLPGCRIRSRERVVPRNIVLKDGRAPGGERLLYPRQIAKPLHVVENRLLLALENGDLRLIHDYTLAP